MNRRQKLYLNSATALLNQIVALVCGFILPKYILIYFGSGVNGLVMSITRFLSVIAFLELGIGPVIQSNLYRPLADKDKDSISKIIVSSEKFYRKIAYIFLAYILVLVFVLPAVNKEFDFLFTASLLIIISISTFAQYFFGITYQLFLNADQKVYIQTSLQMISVILNTVISIILMKIGCGIHVVKLASTTIFVLRPLIQNLYVKRHYDIDRKIKYDVEPIKQKWNGFSQHLAAVVCTNIDVVLLTIFSTYQTVSIYSVYLLITHGVNNSVITSFAGLESYWGNLIAKKENDLLLKTYSSVETIIHFGVTALFVATAILITPFVTVYTNGLPDSAAYSVPLFGMLLTFAFGSQCLRIPYFRIIKAAGHYKQTQNGAFISMTLNIIISTALVFKFGLTGVAIGTIIALSYHTVYFAWYLRKNIINVPFTRFCKHVVIDVIVGILAFLTTRNLSMHNVTYSSWLVYALEISAITFAIAFLINGILFKKDFVYAVKKVLKKV